MNRRCGGINQLIIGFVFTVSAWGQAVPSVSKTGLELSDSNTILVEIAVDDETQKMGLTKERVEARVNTALRKNGLRPAEMDSKAVPQPYLVVTLNVIGSAYHVEMEFRRFVTYRDASKEWSLYGTTWRNGATAYFPSAYKSVDYILDTIGERCELFANALLKANDK